MRTRRLALTAVTALLMLCAGGAAAGVAQAALLHVEFGTPFGNELYPERMALDESSGNIFVTTDIYENMGVRVFGLTGGAPAGGVPVQLFPTETPNRAEFNGGIAFDNSCYLQKLSGTACSTFDPANGDIYVAAPAEHAVDKFQIQGGKFEYVCQFVGWGFTGTACLKNSLGREKEPTEGEFATPEGVAVDSNGNVYIASNNDQPMKVYEFNSAGDQVARIATTVARSTQNIAVDGAGDIFMTPYPGEPQSIVEMKKTGPATYEQQAVTSATGGALAVDATGTVFASHAPYVEEYNSKLEAQSTVGEPFLDPGYGATEAFAIEEANGRIVIAGSCSGCYNGQIHTFTPSVTVPDVAFTTPGLETKSITVNGTVNPDGVEVTRCEIELTPPEYYGGRPNAEYTKPCAPAPGGGSSPVSVSATFSGLEPNSHYTARILGANANGSNQAPLVTYATPVALPLAGEPSATGITRSTAVLGGTVNPENSETTYYFVFGPTSAYGSATPALGAGSGPRDKQVQVKIAGLKTGTTYHYKVVAVNSAGTTESEDAEFTTTASSPPSVSNVTVSGLEPGAAVVTGLVKTNGLPSSYEIDFGTDTKYETHLFGEAEGQEQEVVLHLIYLIPETTYHYRIVVRNEDGTAESPDQTFFTPKYPLKIPQILPQVSALIAGFPTEEGTVFKETVAKTKVSGHAKGKGKKHHKAKKHKKAKKSKKHKK